MLGFWEVIFINAFVDNVTVLLKERKISKNKMLTDLNLSKNSFVDWNKRGTIPSAKVVSAIAEYLNTTVGTLIGHSAEKETLHDFPSLGINSSHPALSKNDIELLSLYHQLPSEAQSEFKGELKGYLKRLNEESVSADFSKKRDTDNLGKSLA